MTFCRDFFLFYKRFTTYGTLLTFRQTSFRTGCVLAGYRFFRMYVFGDYVKNICVKITTVRINLNFVFGICRQFNFRKFNYCNIPIETIVVTSRSTHTSRNFAIQKLDIFSVHGCAGDVLKDASAVCICKRYAKCHRYVFFRSNRKRLITTCGNMSKTCCMGTYFYLYPNFIADQSISCKIFSFNSITSHCTYNIRIIFTVAVALFYTCAVFAIQIGTLSAHRTYAFALMLIFQV